MPSPSEWNRLVNSKWPDNLPIPSDHEAIAGAKRLYKRHLGKFRGKVVASTGNRYTWIRRGVMYVNPNRRGAWQPPAGWPDIVHLLAHLIHARKNRSQRPHADAELMIEADLTRYALEHGFHEGKLKRKTKEAKPKPDAKLVKLEKAKVALAKWESKRKRAETAIRKYHQMIRRREKLAAKQIVYASGLHPTE